MIRIRLFGSSKSKGRLSPIKNLLREQSDKGGR